MNNAPDPAQASVVVVHRRHDSRGWVGVVLVLVGALFFVDRLGWDMGWTWRPTFGRMWPVLLIVAGLAQLASAGRDRIVTDKLGQDVRKDRGRSFPGLWWLFIGVIMLLDQNRWLRLDQSWPLFIVAGGLSILLSQRRHIPRGN
jgi:drug/metabolite transporter (DMT)-like permease